MLDISLLRWPYFSLLRDGSVPDVSKYTKTRNVIGHQRPGFIDGPAVRSYMSAGASLKLNRIADWHRPSSDIKEQLESAFPVAVSTYAFWTPPEHRGMLPHSDGSHVLAIQLEGRKEWCIYSDENEARSAAGLEQELTEPRHRFIMEPGDILYLPHGWVHDARSVGQEDSLHLTFTMAEPTPEAMVEGLHAAFARQSSSLTQQYHQFDLPERTAQTQESLTQFAHEMSDDEWVRNGLEIMRKETG